MKGHGHLCSAFMVAWVCQRAKRESHHFSDPPGIKRRYAEEREGKRSSDSGKWPSLFFFLLSIRTTCSASCRTETWGKRSGYLQNLLYAAALLEIASLFKTSRKEKTALQVFVVAKKISSLKKEKCLLGTQTEH